MFKVNSIKPAENKPGYVAIEVTYEETNKTYTFIRRDYFGSAVIEGHRINWHFKGDQCIIDSIEKEYQTAGKKVTKANSVHIFKKEQKSIKTEIKETQITYSDGKEVFHYQFKLIKTCVESNIPVYLAGPAGSGKNHTLEQIAKALDLEFYFTNSVQQEYKLTGFIDAGGTYHETEFYKAFKNGGLFFLDEMDASIPEVLVLLNAAIANGYFEFPNGKITANENFRVVAAGNTVGSGADETYTGRMVLDQATLDRFAIIEFGYDKKIELSIAKGDKDLVDFIEHLRKEADKKGIRATFSYRCISMVVSLKAKGIPTGEIFKIAVFKGLDKDTINTFSVDGLPYSQYKECFNSLKYKN